MTFAKVISHGRSSVQILVLDMRRTISQNRNTRQRVDGEVADQFPIRLLRTWRQSLKMLYPGRVCNCEGWETFSISATIHNIEVAHEAHISSDIDSNTFGCATNLGPRK